MGELNELHYLALTGKKKGVALPTGNLLSIVSNGILLLEVSAMKVECLPSR